MSGVHFRFSPNILVRLGEELNQGMDQSILELIKNSYDADAKECTVELNGITKAGGEIVVSDNGDGMSAEAIKSSWLVLGKSSKSHLQLTNLGRTPSGSKGLGRLAALRMGRVVSLDSKLESEETSSFLKVEWDRFDSALTVEDVELTIGSLPTTRKKGTITRLSELRAPIRPDELSKLARAVLLLTDPFEDKKSGFKVNLKAPEFKQFEKLFGRKYFDFCEYHLRLTLSDDGFANAEILDWDGKVLQSGLHDDIRNKANSEPYHAPACVFDFWAFLLVRENFSAGQGVSLGDVREWLKHFGGVHVYQDGVRVSPYGSPGDDWLGINLIRTKNPEERPSTNNSIGRLSLNNKGLYQLTQKTDRSGFIEDDAFLEFKQLAVDALDWMARWRLKQAELRRGQVRAEAPEIAKVEKKKFEEVLKQAPPTIRKQLSVAFDSYAKSRDKEADSLRKEVQLYRTLSTAGITAATFAHESHGSPLKIIELGVNTIDSKSQRLPNEADRTSIGRVIGKIRAALDALSILGVATLSLVKASKRRVGRVEVNAVVRQVFHLMQPFLEARDTKVNLDLCSANPFLRCSEAALESIVTNLLNNSLNAFKRGATKVRIINIVTSVTSGQCHVTISDSGPGIVGFKVSDIWLPGVTADMDGTGLGLTIVRDTVKDLGGTVSAVAHGELGGAEFLIKVPVLGE
ncbi:ATP-binding protein [Pseudomonas asiatica]|uniref:sensor histidine kinase n=1 Tax=Pseudomonas asiatica TaxID=2219225 RepID=UPI00209ACBC8|nr:sensor histidine kinase [Pseudomonas asiatica]MCO7536345.1 ATP-binding protein [Pseudomonas asiatica]MCO7550108.1 ATP-binding protein [Pseudomonas asiatica]MCO7560361.1 ATP-binding protein [Pseudomonas asiatica]